MKPIFPVMCCSAILFSSCVSVVRHSNIPPPDAPQEVRTGIDNLVSSDFQLIAEKRVALLVNSASRAADLRPTFGIFQQTSRCRLVAVFTPEHGYDAAATAGAAVKNDTIDGAPFFSLYGKFRRPTREMLASCDVVVADIQDVGIRSYTFVSTLRNVMDACAEFGKEIVVLDRPNPLGGLLIDGAPADTSSLSFVAALPVPYLHGCTVGELAAMMNGENWLPSKRKARLTVVPMTGWKRSMTWENTGLRWMPTSPNVPTPETIRSRAMTGLLGEAGGVSIGIGTALPFRYIGRPDSLAEQVLTLTRQARLPCDAVQVRFKPQFGAFQQQLCAGVMLFPAARQERYFSAGIAILAALRPALPAIAEQARKHDSMLQKVLANPVLCRALAEGQPSDVILKLAADREEQFRQLRDKYLLYKE